MLENTFDEDETCISNRYTTTILNPEITEDDKKHLLTESILNKSFDNDKDRE